jgi:DNA polymerase/3'-5' exonuclease PolX
MMEKNDIARVLDEIATFMELTGENPVSYTHLTLPSKLR